MATDPTTARRITCALRRSLWRPGTRLETSVRDGKVTITAPAAYYTPGVADAVIREVTTATGEPHVLADRTEFRSRTGRWARYTLTATEEPAPAPVAARAAAIGEFQAAEARANGEPTGAHLAPGGQLSTPEHDHTVWAHRVEESGHRPDGTRVETANCITCNHPVHRVWSDAMRRAGKDAPWNQFRLATESIEDQRPAAANPVAAPPPPVPTATCTIEVEDEPGSGRYVTVDEIPNVTVRATDVRTLGAQAGDAARFYREARRLSSVRVRLAVPGGSAATAYADPPRIEHLTPGQRDALNDAYGAGAIVRPDGDPDAEALVTAGLLRRAGQVLGAAVGRQYVPDGPILARFQVDADTANGWEPVKRGERHLPAGTADYLDLVAEAIAAHTAHRDRIRVTVEATPPGTDHPVVVWTYANPQLTRTER